MAVVGYPSGGEISVRSLHTGEYPP